MVVSMHWGAEYRVDPTPEQLAWAEMVLTAPEIDLIVGHHAHVVQPIGKVGDKFVIYGLGNFLSNQRSSTTRVGTEDGVFRSDDGGGGCRASRLDRLGGEWCRHGDAGGD